MPRKNVRKNILQRAVFFKQNYDFFNLCYLVYKGFIWVGIFKLVLNS